MYIISEKKLKGNNFRKNSASDYPKNYEKHFDIFTLGYDTSKNSFYIRTTEKDSQLFINVESRKQYRNLLNTLL